MRLSVRPLTSLFLLCWITPSLVGDSVQWQSLFNGKDLSGWKANILPESFSVENGAIKAHCKAPGLRKSHLFFVGENKENFVTFKNFELELFARGEPNSNSGIFFHTDMTPRDDKEHLRNGYEVQLIDGENPKAKTGSLYSVIELENSSVDEAEWFKIRIKVVDKKIEVFLNEKRVVDYTEPINPKRRPERSGRLLNPEGGAIALQAHDPESVYYFRDIRIRKLD